MLRLSAVAKCPREHCLLRFYSELLILSQHVPDRCVVLDMFTFGTFYIKWSFLWSVADLEEVEPAPSPLSRLGDGLTPSLTVLLTCDSGTVLWRHHRQFISASEMTYIVSGGALNSTHSLASFSLQIYKTWYSEY